MMDFGSLCPWNESTLLASLIRHLPASDDNDNGRRAAGSRNQFQAILFKAPQAIHGPGCGMSIYDGALAVISQTLGPGWVLPILA